MNREHIQEIVFKLHKEIWDHKELLWSNQQPRPIQMLCPKIAAQILGLEYLEYSDLDSGIFPYRGRNRFKSAGLLDRQANKVAVSTAFPVKTVRFTGSHEIAHYILHPKQIMHRDRPIDGYKFTNDKRPLFEREADYFAACYLMPANLLRSIFEELFLTIPFVVNENTSFFLNHADPDTLLRADENSLDREFALARCDSFNGKFFNSLSDQFRVSDFAMAIRIKELKLVRWP